ncbi:5'-deoxynucleotidase HDDC2-like [Halichondria panicea]|uniref:5'-deoxynucleotidase HDDC2-like n=1 Tax=Halichondria panicea TaxID=6063 RepID=UPI00312B9836
MQKECVWEFTQCTRHTVVNAMAEKQVTSGGLFGFFELIGKLKHLKRTGWVRRDIVEPESVASHMYRMSLMSFLFVDTVDPALNRERCIRMSLVHDLAESLVGDITPFDGVSKEEKCRMENEGMLKIKTLVPDQVGEEMYQLWQEYEDGKSPEAIVVKDLDKFDMIFQAYEYEKAEGKPKGLQEFFDSTEGKFQHPEVRKWVEQLIATRNDSNSV